MRCYCGCWCAAFYDAQSITIDLHIPWYVNLLCVLQRPSNFRMGSGHAGHTHSLNFNQKASLLRCWTINLRRRWYDRIVVIMKYCPPFSVGLDRVNRVPFCWLQPASCPFLPNTTPNWPSAIVFVAPLFMDIFFFFFLFLVCPFLIDFYDFSSKKKERKSKQIFGKVFFFLIQILKIVADFNPDFFFCVIAHHLNGWFPSSYSNQFVHSYV